MKKDSSKVKSQKSLSNTCDKKNSENSSSANGNNNNNNIVTILVPVFSVLLAFATIAYNKNQTVCPETPQNVQNSKIDQPPTAFKGKYSAYGDGAHLKHVHLVFERFGYELVDLEEDWDVLWAHKFPFTALQEKMRALKPHQRVNHFPGSGFLTSKVDLAVSGLPFIPPAFRLPKDHQKALEYARGFPNKTFVLKANDHRKIKIVELKDLEELSTKEGYFLQEFMDNSLLVDGYKFDIGVYVIITSIEPLRVYMYNGDILFRYCMKKYYPFDPEDIEKYVVGDDYLPTWEVPSLARIYDELGFSMRDSFDTYLRGQGKDPRKIWTQVQEAIRVVVLAKEKHLISSTARYKSKRNFFEMMRFDFVVDEDLNVFLLEANMSPNLSSAHYLPNRLLYEQVLYNSLALVGVGTYLHEPASNRSLATRQMVAAVKNLAVSGDECNSTLCEDSCVAPACQLCRPCLAAGDLTILTQAFTEHLNRQQCIRVFPHRNAHLLEDLSPDNQKMAQWFRAKCDQDVDWCAPN